MGGSLELANYSKMTEGEEEVLEDLRTKRNRILASVEEEDERMSVLEQKAQRVEWEKVPENSGMKLVESVKIEVDILLRARLLQTSAH